MNGCNEEFLRKNGIDPNRIREEVGSKLCTIRDAWQINGILSSKNFLISEYDSKGEELYSQVSVFDIVGYDHSPSNYGTDIFETMDIFFQKWMNTAIKLDLQPS